MFLMMTKLKFLEVDTIQFQENFSEYCIAVITVRNDPVEQFFDYGYSKDNSKTLYSTKKVKIPSSFKSTVFGIYKNKYEGGAFSD